MTDIPAGDLSPGDVILMDNYPCDILDVQHHRPTHTTVIRWSACPKDVIYVSSNTPFNVLGRLDV